MLKSYNLSFPFCVQYIFIWNFLTFKLSKTLQLHFNYGQYTFRQYWGFIKCNVRWNENIYLSDCKPCVPILMAYLSLVWNYRISLGLKLIFVILEWMKIIQWEIIHFSVDRGIYWQKPKLWQQCVVLFIIYSINVRTICIPDEIAT